MLDEQFVHVNTGRFKEMFYTARHLCSNGIGCFCDDTFSVRSMYLKLERRGIGEVGYSEGERGGCFVKFGSPGHLRR